MVDPCFRQILLFSGSNLGERLSELPEAPEHTLFPFRWNRQGAMYRLERDSLPRGLLLYAALPLAYVITGRLGLLLAVPPGYATAVFLPAGIAIAASFMAGAATLPAIFVGSFLLNIWTGYSIGHQLDSTGVTVALIIASASALQGAIGGAVMRRVIGYPAPLDTARDVASFLVLAPVVCLTSATLSLAGMWAVGVVEPPDLLINWPTWWVGDTVGTLVALPLMLVLAGEPRLLWRSRARFVAVPMMLCFALFVAIFVRVSRWENDASLLEFRLQSQRVAESIKTSLGEQALFLDQLSGVFLSQRTALTHEDFHRLVDKLLHRYPTIRAVEWAPHVAAAEREEFEAAQRANLPGFAIRERGVSGELQPVGNRSQFYPVTYVEPLAGNEQAVGFDLTSDDDRRATIEAANSIGDVVATAPIRLVQERENQTGILLVKSVPESAAGPGIVVAVLGLGTFASLLAEPLQATLAIRFIDTAGKRPFFESFVASTPATYGTTFDFGGRRYLVQTAPTALYLAQHRGWESWAVLAAGVLGTGLLGALLILGTGHAYRVETLAQARQQLATIVEASRDGIWSWTIDGTITTWNAEAERMLGRTAKEILGKSLLTLVPPERLKAAREVIAKVHQGQGSGPLETIRLRKDGTPLFVELTVSPIRDSEERIVAAATVCRDITQRKRAEQTEQILVRELNHRSNNLLTIIQSIAHRSLSGDSSLAAARQAFEARLQALARINRRLTESDWSGMSLKEIVRQELDPFVARVQIDGIDIMLSAQHAQNFSLVLHELATNAAKYGALSNGIGRIAVSWMVPDNYRRRILKFIWQERDGPLVTPPTHRGFGTALLAIAFVGVRLDYAAEGVICEFDVPLES
jgi:PAS domain S-box-containing protein